jgi:hypothetical protein
VDVGVLVGWYWLATQLLLADDEGRCGKTLCPSDESLSAAATLINMRRQLLFVAELQFKRVDRACGEVLLLLLLPAL